MGIEQILKSFGRDVCLANGDGWTSATFRAFIQPLRYKNKMYLEGIYTAAGKSEKGYYLYIGPKEHDLTKSDDFLIKAGSDMLKIERAEKVYFKGEVCYIWAVLSSYGEGTL